jgi:flagellar assembly protein FliH
MNLSMEPFSQTGSPSQAAVQIVAFEYARDPDAPETPSWPGWADAEEPAEPPAESPAELRAGFERKLAEETRKAFDTGRERGKLEQHQAGHEAQAAAEQRRLRQVAELSQRFAAERERYFHAVEREVVELALAVAARILRREAQMDPLLLTGAVRVALGQLAATTEVRLRVPPDELKLWTDSIALVPNLAIKPVVVAGEGMRVGECVLETELGSVDLGIRAQLGEIERGFFDRAGSTMPTGESSSAASAGSHRNGSDRAGSERTR